MSTPDLVRIVESIGDPAPLIDQTLLRPDAGPKTYERFVNESEQYGFRALVVPLNRLSLVAQISRIPVATVIAFPHGNIGLELKLREIEDAASRGAREIDAVIDIGLVVDGLWSDVEREVTAIVGRARELGLGSKVIIETGYLSREQIEIVSRIVARAGASYVKTSTGYGPRGASVEDIAIMKNSVRGSRTGVKASGGIRTIWDLVLMRIAGADIVGSSSGIEIVKQYRSLIHR